MARAHTEKLLTALEQGRVIAEIFSLEGIQEQIYARYLVGSIAEKVDEIYQTFTGIQPWPDYITVCTLREYGITIRTLVDNAYIHRTQHSLSTLYSHPVHTAHLGWLCVHIQREGDLYTLTSVDNRYVRKGI